jgi:hypothetical protein
MYSQPSKSVVKCFLKHATGNEMIDAEVLSPMLNYISFRKCHITEHKTFFG